MRPIVAHPVLGGFTKSRAQFLESLLSLLWGKISFCSGDSGGLCHVANPHSVDLYVKGLYAGISKFLKLVLLISLGDQSRIPIAISVHPPPGGPGSFNGCWSPLVAWELAMYCSLGSQSGLFYSVLERGNLGWSGIVGVP